MYGEVTSNTFEKEKETTLDLSDLELVNNLSSRNEMEKSQKNRIN